jgi:hypothetical protein
MAISNFPNGFANGVNILGLPVLNAYSGTVFWVDDAASGGSNGNKGTFDRPFATIDYAIGRCTANRGDIIMVKAGYAETITAQINADVAGIKIIGMGGPGDMPTITGNGLIDAIDVSAANITISNLKFAAPGTDAQTADINVDAAGCVIANTVHVGSQTAKNKVDLITITANGSDCLIDGMRANNDVVECVGGIKLEGAADNVEVRNVCILDTIGFTNGAIYDAATATNVKVLNSVFSNAKADTVVMEFGNNSTGICSWNFVNGRHTTIQSNVTPGTGMAFNQNYGVEEAAKNGILIPIADVE